MLNKTQGIIRARHILNYYSTEAEDLLKKIINQRGTLLTADMSPTDCQLNGEVIGKVLILFVLCLKPHCVISQ